MPYEATTAKPTGSAGAKRMRELAIQNSAEIADLLRCLIGSLERPATLAEAILAEQIAVAMVRGRRRRDKGAHDRAERAELERLVTGSPWDAKAAPVAASAQ